MPPEGYETSTDGMVDALIHSRMGYGTAGRVTPDEALRLPAVYRAVELLSNLAGSLTLEAFSDGASMASQPPVVRRPNPFTTPREFVRDTVHNLATRGEALWYIASRYSDGDYPSVIVPVAPWMVRTKWDARYTELRYFWRRDGKEQEIPSRDMRHLTLNRDPETGRGFGPLQKCGVALSVAQEADAWADRFFRRSGTPSVLLIPNDPLTSDEAADLKTQWLETPNGEVRVATKKITVEIPNSTPEDSQLLDTRTNSVGDVARMFGIPGFLLEWATAGSSLTYQNVAEVGRRLIDYCLGPNYLEPIEQSFSDLLPRPQTVRFNVDGLLRANRKERYETYKVGIEAGILTPEEARREEGYAAGGLEVQPIPQRR